MFAFNISTLATQWINKKINLNGSNLIFKAPKSWQIIEGLYGRDIAILGPEKGPKRDVITIEQAKSKAFSLSSEKKALEEYKKIKNSWIKKKSGSLNKFLLGQKLASLKKKHLFNEVSYSLSGENFIEGDLFLKCTKDTFLNISFLTLEKKSKAFKKIWIKLLNYVDC